MRGDDLFSRFGSEEGCRAITAAFYGRVQTNDILRPLFPGKSLRCATEEFTAFLIQFFDGDEDQTQYRWWLSLEQSHHRFKISEVQRQEWLKLMVGAIDEKVSDAEARQELKELFSVGSRYVALGEAGEISSTEITEKWDAQLELDKLITLIRAGKDALAIESANRFLHRKGVSIGIFAEMMKTERPELVNFVVSAIQSRECLKNGQFNGRSLLHHAAGCGCLKVVYEFLALGVDPNILDSGGHSPLFRAASCEKAGEVVRELIKAGADPNLREGVTLTSPLHQAARFGCLEVIAVLIQLGADKSLVDKNGSTPLERAMRCRKWNAAELLSR